MAFERENVPANLKWRVEDIYETQDAWEADYASLDAKIDFSAYEGKLNTAETLLECMEKVNEVALILSKLSV